METEAKVLEAVALLRQAGRIDLLKDGALALTRPARKASAGVAAAVAACSPPRVAPAVKVRGAASGVVTKGGSGAGTGSFSGRERGGESPKVSRGTGRAGRRPSWIPARKWRAGPHVAAEQQAREEKRAGALEQSAAKKGIEKKAGGRQGRPGEYRQKRKQASAAGAPAAPVVFPGTASAPSGNKKKVGNIVGADCGPLDLGASPGAGQSGVLQERGRKGTPRFLASGNPEGEFRGLEEGWFEEGLEGVEGSGSGGQWDISSSPGTPDLSWQGPLDYGDEDPGEQDAARVHWGEGKAGPWAASRIASSGWSRRRSGAADASTGRCGGEGVAPPVAAAQKEQRPGPSRRRSKDRGEYSNCVRCGGSGASAVMWEERSEESLEEGELRNSGSEYEWWESGGRGTSNPVRKSLQVQRSGTRRGASRGERKGGEARTVQERLPLLSPGQWSPGVLSCGFILSHGQAHG
ncbi:hypothetical protein NDU88_002040 [Pleurodeles waltl]|uniref:Uncharacterized protein n=1 Tax=Pleurodeles waltl TaxID=8319 RepID=A0AAV7Q8R5_PLEWA|nr:hypothetical protein NDU88_002040 [Pleurodeles waltl]